MFVEVTHTATEVGGYFQVKSACLVQNVLSVTSVVGKAYLEVNAGNMTDAGKLITDPTNAKVQVADAPGSAGYHVVTALDVSNCKESRALESFSTSKPLAAVRAGTASLFENL